jgi:hypothetical protein
MCKILDSIPCTAKEGRKEERKKERKKGTEGGREGGRKSNYCIALKISFQGNPKLSWGLALILWNFQMVFT